MNNLANHIYAQSRKSYQLAYRRNTFQSPKLATKKGARRPFRMPAALHGSRLDF